MFPIELHPTLSHCVESAAREEYNNSLREYLRLGGGKELEARIELLKDFLESMDFPALRKESERLMQEGKKVRFVIDSEEGRVKYEMKIT